MVPAVFKFSFAREIARFCRLVPRCNLSFRFDTTKILNKDKREINLPERNRELYFELAQSFEEDLLNVHRVLIPFENVFNHRTYSCKLPVCWFVQAATR